jgi:alkylated DNA repair dioxygenase AlkB
MQPKPFSKSLLEIKEKIDEISQVVFTSCLANLYRYGADSNGWHSDNEKELGENPIIASISFGEERYFHFKHRTKKTLKHKIKLQHGSLLLMKGSTQNHWLHQIPKTKKDIGKRINLTFRNIA